LKPQVHLEADDRLCRGSAADEAAATLKHTDQQ
jgi:hypothetical protein